MALKEILRQVVQQQKQDLVLAQDSVRREILDEILRWIPDERILILTGMRRCGKSTLLKQIMAISSRWCYVNFEDERLINFEAKEFEVLNEVLLEIYGEIDMYIFDEIQNIEKFETFVRRLQDQRKKIVLTGSNAALLSKEFGTRLTGRYKLFEVYPFSFSEFLAYRGISMKKDEWYDSEKKVKYLGLYREYSVNGGLPEYVKNKDRDYIRTLLENIIYRDIVARYSIRREKVLKELVNILATNATLPITYNSLKKTLALSNAITVKEYISYLHNAYLFFELLKFSPSIKSQLSSPRKIYLVDTAFHQVCGFTMSPNTGRILENLVYVELRRRGNEIYYFSGQNECDFIIKQGAKICCAYQVCSALDASNRTREIEGLLEAMKKFNIKEGFILTMEQNEETIIEGKKITILPVSLWSTFR